MLCGCHSPVGGRVCSPVVGVAALRVGFNQALLPLSGCPAPGEVINEARESRVVTEDLHTTCVDVHGSAQKQPKVAPLSLLCSPQI